MARRQQRERKQRRKGHPRIRRFGVWLLRLRGSPEAIAGGIAIGLFVAFTPTIGFQIVLATFLATILNANRPAAIAMVWVTNPITIPPMFSFTYWVGTLFWPRPSHAHIERVLRVSTEQAQRHELWEMNDRLMAFAATGRDVFVPLLVGGILVGAAAGGLAYAVTLRLLRRYRHPRARSTALRGCGR